jgi:hypothetical protein
VQNGSGLKGRLKAFSMQFPCSNITNPEIFCYYSPLKVLILKTGTHQWVLSNIKFITDLQKSKKEHIPVDLGVIDELYYQHIDDSMLHRV